MLIVACAVLWAGASEAATYYIDWDSGSDGGGGTSKASPWKRHPFMHGFSGSYSHQAGDMFIFKGGVTWPNAAFDFEINQGGNASQFDRYTVDPAWFSGAGWSRPVFDLENATAASGSSFPFRIKETSYVEVSGIEVKRIRINAGVEFHRGSITISESQNVIISNCYVHSWYVAPSAVDSFFGGIIGSGSSSLIVKNCIVHGSEVAGHPGKYSGVGVRFVSELADSEVYDVPQGIWNCGYAHGNEIYNIRRSFDGKHPNGVTYYGGGWFYDNVVHHVEIGVSIGLAPTWGGGSGKVYCFNNIIYSVGPPAITVFPNDNSAANNAKVHIYNNIIRKGTCVRTSNRSEPPLDNLFVKNNLFISDSANPIVLNHPVENLEVASNVQLSQSEAVVAGYLEENQFRTPGSSSPTADTGMDLSAYFTTDREGTERPQFSGWDVGAYEYHGSSSGVAPKPPSQLVISNL